MITGFNTDVDYQGRVYHVQTEDRGQNHPVVESLVYCGGEIIASRKLPYGDLLHSGEYAESAVQRKMEEQHSRLIREIHNGKFDTEALKPFGHSIVTNRSFDQVVLSFLEEQPVEQVQLKVTGPKALREGSRPTLKLELHERSTDRPVGGAIMLVRLIEVGTPVRDLFSGLTDEHGRVEAALDIPKLTGAEAVIVCQADADGKTAEIKRLVQKAVPRATGRDATDSAG